MFVDPLVNLIADEVLPSVEFYTRHLGFTETFRTPRDDIPVHVELVLGTLKIAISARSAARTDDGLDLQPGPPRSISGSGTKTPTQPVISFPCV